MIRPTTIVALVEEYLARRRRMGFALQTDASQLLAFARFVDTTGHRGPLTPELVERWALLPGARPRQFPARRVDVVRPFLRHLTAFGLATEVPSRGALGRSRVRPIHHIYTDAEINALLAAARRLAPITALRPLTYVTFFGMLAVTGLRVSEALRLTCEDVDLEAEVLTVHVTKYRKSRLVPLHPTAAAALRDYAIARDRAVRKPVTRHFFGSARGAQLPYSTVRTVFRGLSKGLGWEDHTPRPRIHDLRHTFACRRMQRWYAEGADVSQSIASLATYLGHAKVSDTYWYLTGTPELLALAAARFETFAASTGGAR